MTGQFLPVAVLGVFFVQVSRIKQEDAGHFNCRRRRQHSPLESLSTKAGQVPNMIDMSVGD